MAKRYRLYPLATRWLQFVGRLQQRPSPLTPSAKKVQAFANYMEHEANLSPVTIYHRCWWVKRFFDQLRVRSGSLDEITSCRIDVAFQKMLPPEGSTRATIQSLAGALRAFFRFAETRGWCRKGLAMSIRSPRMFSEPSLPMGPSWDDVCRLLAMTEDDQRHNSARPILMLLAVYGLRTGEVTRMHSTISIGNTRFSTFYLPRRGASEHTPLHTLLVMPSSGISKKSDHAHRIGNCSYR